MQQTISKPQLETVVLVSVLEASKQIVNSIYERFLKEFMDVLIMVRIREGEIGGYDIINYFHHKFDLLVSPGTVYSVLYSMEREGLIKARTIDRKRTYALTPKGEMTIRAISESGEVLEGFFTRLLEGCEPIATQVM